MVINISIVDQRCEGDTSLHQVEWLTHLPRGHWCLHRHHGRKEGAQHTAQGTGRGRIQPGEAAEEGERERGGMDGGGREGEEERDKRLNPPSKLAKLFDVMIQICDSNLFPPDLR